MITTYKTSLEHFSTSTHSSKGGTPLIRRACPKSYRLLIHLSARMDCSPHPEETWKNPKNPSSSLLRQKVPQGQKVIPGTPSGGLLRSVSPKNTNASSLDNIPQLQQRPRRLQRRIAPTPAPVPTPITTLTPAPVTTPTHVASNSKTPKSITPIELLANRQRP